MILNRRIAAIALKEFLHIRYDIRSLLIIFAMPVIMLVMYGYALKMEIQNIRLAVYDFNLSRVSNDLIEQFRGSTYFTVFIPDVPVTGADELFRSRTADAALVIREDFDRSLRRDSDETVQLLIDAQDPNKATLIRTYFSTVLTTFNQQMNGRLPLPFEIKPRIWYNPDMKSAYFFVPGLIALILVMISALLTSITIAREKETGTMEQILVSPIRPGEIIIGKVLPYIVLALLDGFIILVIGLLLFDIPFEGSSILLLLLSLLYIITALSLGLMLSTMVRTQQVAMMLALSMTLLPTFMLSGFIFPIQSMPVLLQYLSYLVPAKYYLTIIRGIMLKGNTLSELVPQVLLLLGMTVILLLNAMRRFRTNLEK